MARHGENEMRPVRAHKRLLPGARHNPYAAGVTTYEAAGGRRVTNSARLVNPIVEIISKRGRPRKDATARATPPVFPEMPPRTDLPAETISTSGMGSGPSEATLPVVEVPPAASQESNPIPLDVLTSWYTPEELDKLAELDVDYFTFEADGAQDVLFDLDGIEEGF